MATFTQTLPPVIPDSHFSPAPEEPRAGHR